MFVIRTFKRLCFPVSWVASCTEKSRKVIKVFFYMWAKKKGIFHLLSEVLAPQFSLGDAQWHQGFSHFKNVSLPHFKQIWAVSVITFAVLGVLGRESHTSPETCHYKINQHVGKLNVNWILLIPYLALSQVLSSHGNTCSVVHGRLPQILILEGVEGRVFSPRGHCS